jgi:hypothetical protein
MHALPIDLRAWLRAGEEGALIVYNKHYRVKLLLVCCTLATSWAFPPVMRQCPIGFLVIAAFWLPRILAEGRRAFIFTNTEVIYRPLFAQPLCTAIAGIQSLKRSKVTLSFGLRAIRRPGVMLTTMTGETTALPLDFKEREEILQRVSEVTGKTVAE